MPFESKAQRRFMHAKHPDIAKRWEKHTPKGKKLIDKKAAYDFGREVGHVKAAILITGGLGAIAGGEDRRLRGALYGMGGGLGGGLAGAALGVPLSKIHPLLGAATALGGYAGGAYGLGSLAQKTQAEKDDEEFQNGLKMRRLLALAQMQDESEL